MTEGDAVGPAVIREVIGQEGPMLRCRGTLDDREVEILVLDTDDATVRDAFVRVHAELMTPAHPDVVPTLNTVDIDANRVAAIREWTRMASAPDAPEAASEALRMLVPAVRAAGPALLSETAPRDIRRRENGRYAVAPWGVRMTADTPYRAPESYEPSPDSSNSALYGLGVWVYQSVTQHLPVPAGLRTDEAPPVPPTKWRPDLPFNLAQALIALVAPQPGTRTDALDRLSRTAPPATAVPGTVKVTTRPSDDGPRSARVDTHVETPGAVLSVAASDLMALSPAEQSALAGWADVPVSAVREAIAAGRPLAVRGLATTAAARQQLTALQTHASIPLSLTTPPSLMRVAFLAVLGTLGVATITTAALLGIYWIGLFSLVFFALGLVSAMSWLSGARQFRTIAEALPQASPTLPAALDQASKRAAALRRRLASLELPSTAAVDVRGAIGEIEDQIAAVAKVHVAYDDADALQAALAPIRAALDTLEADLPIEARLVPESHLERVHQATVSVHRTLSDRS